jgi:hypothetical protein
MTATTHSIFGTGTDLNDFASLDIINLIDRVLIDMTYDEQQANAEIVAELYAERDEVETWRDAFLEAWEDDEDVYDSATILDYMA